MDLRYTLELITLVLGVIQLVDILVALALYYLYGRKTEYLTVACIWVGMSLFFVMDHFLGDASSVHPLFSFIFSGFSGLGLGLLLAQLYHFKFHFKFFAIFLGGLYFFSACLVLFGVKNFTIIALPISVGVTLPVFFSLFRIWQRKYSDSHKQMSGIDNIFIVIVLIWGLHFLDYPFLRPLASLEASIFGFSFGLLLTYFTSILFPVVINYHIHSNLNSILKQKLEEKSVELKEIQDQVVVRDKLATIGKMTSGIAHELKNPLGVILNASSIIAKSTKQISKLCDDYTLEQTGQTDFINKISEKTVKIANMEELIHKSVTRSDGVIKSLLGQARLAQVQLSNTDLSKVVTEHQNLALHSQQSDFINSVLFELDLDETIGSVQIYSQEFGRIIINLFENSFDSIRQKILKVEKTYRPKIFIKTENVNNDFFKLTFEDNGMGMSDKVKDKALEPFFTTKPYGEGTGLGMTLISDVVKLHSGHLEIQTQENKFARFVFVIPKKQKEGGSWNQVSKLS